MELLEGSVLSRLLLDRYSRNPRGWSFVVSPAQRYGFFDAFFSSPEEAWHLKLDSVFKPQPLMLGAETDLTGKRVPENTVPFGYRALKPSLALKLIQTSEAAEDSGGPGFDFATLLGNLETVVPNRGGSYAEGPFVYSNQRVLNFTPQQKSVDDRLSSELLKLVRNRYPSYR